MSAKHTPGPWVVSRSADKRTGTHVRTARPLLPGASDGVSVCRVTYLDEGAPANATLIAAAPELLDANKSVFRLVGDIARLIRSGEFSEKSVWAVCERIEDVTRYAVAKAEGEQP